MYTCFTTYLILIVFFIDVFIHILFHVASQTSHFQTVVQKEKDIRESIRQEREEILSKPIKERYEIKDPEYLKVTDPIVISTSLKTQVLVRTLTIICVYGLLVLNIIPNFFKFYFSILAIFNAIAYIVSNVSYMSYDNKKRSTEAVAEEISFYDLSTKIIYYLTLFSIPVLTILLAIQDMFSPPIQLPYLCVVVQLLFFILYAYLCYSIYVQYSNLKYFVKTDIYDDPSTFSKFKSIHEYIMYSMILNFFVYGIIVILSALSYVDRYNILALVGIISGTLTLSCTLTYWYFVSTAKKPKLQPNEITIKLYRNMCFIAKCFLLGLVTIYQGYTLYNTSEI